MFFAYYILYNANKIHFEGHILALNRIGKIDMGGQLTKLRLDFVNNKNLTAMIFDEYMRTLKKLKNL